METFKIGNDTVVKLEPKLYARHFNYTHYTAIVEVNDYHVDIKIYEMAHRSNDVPMFQRSEESFSGEREGQEQFTTFEEQHLKNAEICIKMSIKWDGCTDWSFGNPEYDMHACGVSGLRDFGLMLIAVYEWAGPMIPNWRH